MRDEQPSFTAAWVAAMRGLGAYLPQRLRLVDDPYGLRFARGFRRLSPRADRVGPSPWWLRGGMRRFAIYMQVRTRVIDDDVDAFARAGGRQIVLLGAGFDCRAWRLRALEGATVFEVDHPATQAKKRAIMDGQRAPARVAFVPWHFERQPLAELPARLAREGHDAGKPTMTILEGVLMYLTADATDSTFACIKSYSAPGSPAAITYMDRSLVHERSGSGMGRRLAVRLVGEPFRSGWVPGDVPAWLDARGFRLDRDESATQVGGRLLGPELGRRMASRRNARSHFALVRRA